MRIHSLYGRIALLVACSPNALERAQAQAALRNKGAASPDAERRDLIARLKKLDEPEIVKLVEARGLPASTGKWSLDQLRDIVTTIEGGGEKAAETTQEARVFVLAYKADGSSVEVHPGMSAEEWDAWTPPDEHEAVMVSSAEELADVPNDVLLALVNQAKGTKVKKFANPDAARDQAFESMGHILDKATTTATSAATKAAKTPKEPKAPKEPAAPKLINREPKAMGEIKPVGEGTKIAMLIELLSQKEGTTVEEIEAELSKSGKPVKASAWLGYDLNSVTGYGVRQDADSKRLFLVLPKGMTKPLPYKEKKAAPAPAATKKVVEEAAVEEAPAKAAPAAKKVAPAKAAAAPTTELKGIAKINAEKAAAKSAASAAPAAPAKKAAKK